MSLYQNMNQFGMSALKGKLANNVSPNTIAVAVDPNSVATLVAGDAVKLTTTAGAMILVDKCAATDGAFGFVIYTPKKDKFVANDVMEIALGGSIIYLEAAAAINRGDSLEFVATGSLVKTALGVNPVQAVALDAAAGANVVIKAMLLPTVGTTPTSGSFTTLNASGNFAVNTNKFVVTAASGNTACAGILTAKTIAGAVSALASAATIAFDPTLGNVFTHTPTQNETINCATVPAAGQEVTLVITTSGASSFTLTFGTNFKSTATLATGTTTAKVFVMKFVSDGVNLNEVSRTTAM